MAGSRGSDAAEHTEAFQINRLWADKGAGADALAFYIARLRSLDHMGTDITRLPLTSMPGVSGMFLYNGFIPLQHCNIWLSIRA